MRLIHGLDEYFGFLGAERTYGLDDCDCELCGAYDFEVIRNFIDGGGHTFVPIKVKICRSCGYVMQHPKFERQYYRDFYRLYYNQARARSGRQEQVQFVDASGGSTDTYLENTVERGQLLLSYLEDRLPKNGSILDVGCGCGGFLVPFQKRGWEVYGNDPEKIHIDQGNEKWDLGLEAIDAEDMEYEADSLDLVIIMGSLEHAYDPNVILAKCWRSLKPRGMIVIEGRFFPIGPSYRYFNANHHRYLREKSCQLLLLKHGFKTYEVTTAPVTGDHTGRDGDGFVFARKEMLDTQSALVEQSKNRELVENVDHLRQSLEAHDLLLE